MKKYKANSPFQTVHNIRTILYNNDIFLKEVSYSNSRYFHSCRLILSSDDLYNLNIGSGGKGMSIEYSLASAYAEFMERLQNNFLLSGQQYAIKKFIEKNIQSSYSKRILNENLVLDFIYDDREKSIDIEQSIHENLKFYLELFPFIKKEEDAVAFFRDELDFKTVISIPFYSREDKEEIYLPIEIIHIACGSNGMASGNTKQEALIQGFCEIFERFVGREIYYGNLTPPDVPLEIFKGRKIFDTIRKLIDETNYQVIIKDCSLGKGIPVLGALIIDTEKRKYNFNLGSALSPEIALERCLTEIYQNPGGIYWMDIVLDNFNKNSKYTDDFVYVNGNMIFNCSSGYWPLSLFDSKLSYEFAGLNFSLNETDETDIEFIVNKIKELGYNIYIRDVSYLGFPSYYIIVPGMSQYPNSKLHYSLFGDSVGSLRNIRHIKKLTEEEIRNICNFINKDYVNLKRIGYKVSNIFLYNTDYDLNNLDIELLFFMLNYRINDLKKSLFYMSKFLEDKDFHIYSYYYGIKDYVDLKIKGFDNERIFTILNNIYTDELANEIISDLSDYTKIFDNHDWTNCFDCDDCKLMSDCRFFKVLSIIKKLQAKQKMYEVNYNNFSI